MLLTIITINRNNASGLAKTMQSVLEQSRSDFEYVVIDGASKDDSCSVIQRYSTAFGDRLKWISEPDKGIYNAMNKGIGMASGQYLQFLNSGDCLASEEVIAQISETLEQKGYPSILYGNMLKDKHGKGIIKDKGFAGREISFLKMFLGTLNHSSTFIQRSSFDRYGLYDESLKIVSDWKWFLQAIIFGGEKPVYTDIDVVLFDMTGISETNKGLCQVEREKVLSDLVNPAFLIDYRKWSSAILQMNRLMKHSWAYKIVWFIERCLFKWEKWSNAVNKG